MIKDFYFKNQTKEGRLSIRVFDSKNKNRPLFFYSTQEEFTYSVDLEKYDRIEIRTLFSKSLPIFLNEYTPDFLVKTYGKTSYLNVLFYNHDKKKTGVLETKEFSSKDLSFRKYKLNTYIFAHIEDPSKPAELFLAYDGQNMYSGVGKYSKADPYGGWQLDVILAHIASIKKTNYVVIGIDNATKYREKELIASNKFGKHMEEYTRGDKNITNGRLESFDKYIHDAIIPYVKEKYNIKSGYTVLGSSCGGFASFYTGLKHSREYKRIITLSPAFCFFDYSSYSKIMNKKNYPDIYMAGGYKGELEQLLMGYVEKNKTKFKNALGKSLTYEKINEFDHNEIAWRYFLVDALKRLDK